MRRPALAFALIAASGLSAQTATWKIPERGAVLYERSFSREIEVIEPANGRRDIEEIPKSPPTAVLLHSELGRKGRALANPPGGVLSLAHHLAFDLQWFSRGNKRTVDLVVPGLGALGDLRLRGTATLPTGFGEQTLELSVAPSPPPREKRKEGAKPPDKNRVQGRLVITRQVDLERGVVTQFTSAFEAEIHFAKPTRQKTERARFRVLDDWALREVVGNRGPAFKARVDDAIRRGAAYLKERLEGDLQKEFDPKAAPNGETRKTGELALFILTLLRAGESPFDRTVAAALDDLKRRNIPDTYSLGVALMALEACYTPPSEREAMLAGTIRAPYPRNPSPEDKACMERWVEALLGNRDVRQSETMARWNYRSGKRFDNSNSQYALLGLYAAQLCGTEVDPEIWRLSALSFLKVQLPDGDPFRLDLLTHRQLAKSKLRRTAGEIDPAGWGYIDRRPCTGSMTTAGLTGLTICDAALDRRRPKEVSIEKLREARNAGYAWLAQNYSVRLNPGRGDGWRYYYLYGIERCCELAQIAHLQDRDWYFDGATMLLEEQKKNGDFSPSEDWDTCFAILFLKKTALPALTGRR